LIDAIHENLLPAIDRCTIVASELRGQANYHDSSKRFNANPKLFTRILNILSCLRLILHHVLYHATEEQRRLLAFTQWLRFQIDWQASPNTSESDGMMEREASINYPEVLQYIQESMQQTKLSYFFTSATEKYQGPTGNSDDDVENQTQIFQKLAALLDGIRDGDISRTEPIEKKAVPIAFFCNRLQHRIRDAIAAMAKWQADMAAMKGGIVLESQDACIVDMRMVYRPNDTTFEYSTRVALVPETSKAQGKRSSQMRTGFC
jgi:anaphase-promoting complex subunit 4